MQSFLDTVLAVFYAVPWLIALAALAAIVWFSGAVRYISNTRVGIMEKLWSLRGSVPGGLIALHGEAGFQPDVLRGGIHLFVPFMYRLHVEPLVTINQGKIGYVFARDGTSLLSSQTLASNEHADDFENVRVFLASGGQKGPQRKILREGTYAINLAQFVVVTEERLYTLSLSLAEFETLKQMQGTLRERGGFVPLSIRDNDDRIGIVTVHDGPALPPGEIIAPIVGVDPTDTATFHNNFQEPERFLAAGGFRGRQFQVLVDGTYYVNRLFATVGAIEKTIIPVGFVGVVISYTGVAGTDMSGTAYRHGELVGTNQRGVWKTPLLPGKYAFNTYAGKIEPVPTTNFVLKWAKGSTGGHKLDENLSDITLITKDAFEPALPLSVVMHIDYERAPEVVQRFGDVRKLVEQTLDPMVSAYFKDIGQKKTLIELLQGRSEIRGQAQEEMHAKFDAYSLKLEDVLIGTPRATEADPTIERILNQLRERQIAVEQVATYQLQGTAATEERTLNEAKATAAMQAALTQSAIHIRVNENEGAAALARANKDADTVRVTAMAEADKRRLEGEGEAARVWAVGEANAKATKAQVDAYGGPDLRLAEQVATRMFEAVAAVKQPLVPETVVYGGGGDAAGGTLAGLMAMLLPRIGEITRALKPPPGDVLPPRARNGSP